MPAVFHYEVAAFKLFAFKFGLRLDLRSDLRTKKEFLSEMKNKTKLLSSL